jgi:potassium-dependent mechanosensitive channel
MMFRLIFILALTFTALTISSGAMGQEPISADTFLTAPDTVEAPEKPQITLEELIRKNETYTIALNNINVSLGRKIDTTQLYRELPEIETVVAEVAERLQTRESTLNLRYLGALENLVINFKATVIDWQQTLNERNQALREVGEELEAIKADEALRVALRDTTLLPEYQKQTQILRNRLSMADSAYQSQRLKLARAQTRVSSTIITLNDFEEEIDLRQSNLERALFSKENNFLWESPEHLSDKRLRDLMRESLALNELILGRYFNNNMGRHLLVFFLGAAFFIWFFNLLKRVKQEKDYSGIILERATFIPKSVTLSATLAVLSLTPFFYLNPPTAFVQVILTITAVLATILIYDAVEKPAFYLWLGLLGIFLCFSISNLYVEIAFKERWFLLGLNAAGILLAFMAIRLFEKAPEKYPKYISFFIYLYFAMQVLSLLSNIMGRYSLSKMLGVASTNSLVQAITLYAFVTIILEAIYLQLEVSRSNQKEFASYFDFRGIQKRLKNFLISLTLIIWVYYFTNNLNIYEYLYIHTIAFLVEERHFGSFDFTYGSILIFITLIWAATFLARNIAYFAEMKDQAQSDPKKKKLGSSILLIKLGVLIVGFLLAITASGISLDKVAIVLGALSVGIGFGLQTIVNNLVSGVIIAFEKPIQVGDIIEIGTRMGVVKEVGIRASKVKTYDGSEVIIPNGDLLSEHLINWTLSDKTRRVELYIGVAYGSDADKVTQLLMQVMDHEGILKEPKPAVYLQSFADSAVEFRLLFWVGDINTWVVIRSQIMNAIYKAFAKEGIEIPFPQRDLHIKSMPQEEAFILKEKISEKPSQSN